jgi:hypothetical protein
MPLRLSLINTDSSQADPKPRQSSPGDTGDPLRNPPSFPSLIQSEPTAVCAPDVYHRNTNAGAYVVPGLWFDLDIALGVPIRDAAGKSPWRHARAFQWLLHGHAAVLPREWRPNRASRPGARPVACWPWPSEPACGVLATQGLPAPHTMSVAAHIALPACSGLPWRQHTSSTASAGTPITVPPRKPQEVSRETHRQWAQLSAVHHQLLLAH